MEELMMTEDEIVQSYLHAESTSEKKSKIKILSELNGCEVSTIRNLLVNHGCSLPAMKRKTSNEGKTEAKESNYELPGAVFKACMNQVESLQKDIESIDAEILKLQDQKDKLVAEKMDIEHFLGKGDS
jgi:hypothetical protein